MLVMAVLFGSTAIESVVLLPGWSGAPAAAAGGGGGGGGRGVVLKLGGEVSQLTSDLCAQLVQLGANLCDEYKFKYGVSAYCTVIQKPKHHVTVVVSSLFLTS
jgi:hypothetical protein